MTKSLKNKWIEALNRYPKIQNCLRDDKGFCAFGVLCDICGDIYWERRNGIFFAIVRDTDGLWQSNIGNGYIPRYLRGKYKISPDIENRLIELNFQFDSFGPIIRYIETNVKTED